MPYNWAFSLSIARQFADKYPRASEFFAALYETNRAYPAKLFQFQQKRWELYKFCVIKLSSVLKGEDYKRDSAEDLALLFQKMAYIMFKAGKNPSFDEKLLNKRLLLTKFQECLNSRRTA